MKIAVAGKGGSGKTTVSGTMARSLGADGYDVLTIDDDDDPNLSVALGVPRGEAGQLLPDDVVTRLGPEADGYPYELTRSPREIAAAYGIEAPDGVVLLQAGEIEAGAGCFGTSHAAACLVMSRIVEDRDEVTVMDMPNGIEHLGLATAKDVDVMVVVVEPSYNSMETARKIRPLAAELDIPELGVLANKIRTDRDREIVEEYCAEHDLALLGAIPYDETVREAERAAAAPIDRDPEGPAVRAIGDLAAAFVEDYSSNR